jgi:hypothetical protein
MVNKESHLLLKIDSSSADDDAEKLAELTDQLREDIEELDVERVDLIKSKEELPKGAKADDVVTWGSLLVTLVASNSNILPNLIGAVQSWLTRHERRKITVEYGTDKLELLGGSSEQQQQLIDDWVSRNRQRHEKVKQE